MSVISYILGFPRIGIHRELKKAQESYWASTLSQQQQAGVDLLPVGDFA